MYKNQTVKVNYTDITNEIISLIEQGIMPMGNQWTSTRNQCLPFNLLTNKQYKGINILHLWVTEMKNKYTSNGWITINQMKQIGLDEKEPIRLITLPDDAPNRADNKTGQKGVHVFHAGTFIPKEWKMQQTNGEPVFRSEHNGDYADEKDITKSYLKVAGTVFNLDQIENLPEKYQNFDELKPFEDQEPEITKLTNAYGVPILLSPDGRCYYRMDEHKIYLVHQDLFKSLTDFERVKFHELVHSTGHESLLARIGVQENTKKDMATYAFEELVAEFGASFLCAQFGIPGLMVHAEYIDHYVKLLKKDNKAVFKAAAKAQAAVEFLMSHLPDKLEEAA
jgi:antirestriction protein ArdC